MNQDVLIDFGNENDLQINDGDFVIGGSDLQHVAAIVSIDKGQLKQTPLLGVGIIRALNGPIDGSVKRSIQLNLQKDGYQYKSAIFSNGNLAIKI